MKRRCLIILTLLATLTAMAQNADFQRQFYVGGKAGVTMSRTQFSPSVPQSMIMGFAAGATFRYIEQNHFGLIAELNIEQRGWKEKFDEGYDFAYRQQFTFIQLPLLTHIYFGNNRIHGFFNAGPELGYMIGHSVTANFDYENISSVEGFPRQNRSVAQYVEPIKNKFDYGISAGVGMEIFARKHSFTLEGRFYYGLRDVFSNHKKDPFAGSNGLSMLFTLGYNYRIK